MSFTAAVIGTGFIGPVHIEALRRISVRVVGVLGSSPERSRQAAERWGLERAYDDLNELLTDGEVDVVHITSPNRFHYEQAAAALRAGKQVLCEKPLAMDARQSAELVRLAAASGRAAGVNYNLRFYPLCREAAERVRGGHVGRVLHVAGSYVQDWLLHDTDFNWRVLADEGGPLRAVADIGTHWLDLLHAITGLEVEAVCADLATVHPVRRRPAGGVETFSGAAGDGARVERIPVAIDTEDYGAILLRFVGGARGVLWVSQTTAGRKNCLRFEVAGADEAFAWDSQRPDELWIGRRDEANRLLLRDPALLSPAARQLCDYPGGHNEGFADTFKQCFRAFYDYLAAGDLTAAAPFPTFADGHREIVICEAIVRSAREQRWALIEETE